MFSLTKFPSLLILGFFAGNAGKLLPPIKLGCLFTTFTALISTPSPFTSVLHGGGIESEAESLAIDFTSRLVGLRIFEKEANLDKYKPPAGTLHVESSGFSSEGRRIWKGRSERFGTGIGEGDGSG